VTVPSLKPLSLRLTYVQVAVVQIFRVVKCEVLRASVAKIQKTSIWITNRIMEVLI